MSDDLHPDTILKVVSFIRTMYASGRVEIGDDLLYRLESRLLSDKMMRNSQIIVDEGVSQWAH